MEFLNGNNPLLDAMTYVEQKTRIPKNLQFYVLVILTGLWLIFGYGAALLCNIIAYIYPAYESIRAIETPEKEDDTQWLMYWTVFGFFACFDSFVVNFSDGLPFYYLLKCIFLIWCYLPIEQNGSYVLYNHVIRGIFIKYHEQIDEAFRATGRQICYIAEQLAEKGKAATGKLAEAGKEAVASVTQKSKEAIEQFNKKGMQEVDGPADEK